MRVVIAAILLALLSGACSSAGPKTGEVPDENLATICLDVKGMTCEGCEKAIVGSIRKLDGIQEASASHTAREAVVKYDSMKTNMDAIIQAIADAGYSVEGEKTERMHQ